MSHSHSHHGAHHHPKLSGKNLLISIFLNLLITVVQIIGGFISGSLALISDAVHNLSDVISLIVSYVANRLANSKKQTLKQTFGFKRAEIIAAFFNAATLIIIAIILAIEAFKRFTEPQQIKPDIVIWLALVGILANGFSVLLLKKDANHNLNMKSAYLHLLTDMLASIAVFIGGLVMKYYAIFWIDAVLTLVISVYLIYMSWRIFLESLKILMLFAPDDIVIKDIEKAILKIKGIKNIHHVHLWQLNENNCHFEAHIEFKKDIKLSDFDFICEQIEHILIHDFNINHCNLQPEFNRDDEKMFIIQD